MKRFSLLILLLLITQSFIFGQSFESVFCSDTTQWNYFTDYNGFDFFATAVFKASGDTIISDLSYKNLYEDYINGFNLYGFLREDIITGKLWLKIVNDTSEYLVMDLSLDVNDTFILRNKITNDWDEIFIVENIILEQNKKSIILRGMTTFNEIKFMEGIGVNYIFHLIEKPWIYYDFLCSYKNQQIVYDNPNHSECYIPFTGTFINNLNKEQIQIYPIPTNGNLTIDFNQSGTIINHFSIFNIYGFELINGQSEKSIINIDLSLFENGIYFINVNGTLTKKIIKTHANRP